MSEFNPTPKEANETIENIAKAGGVKPKNVVEGMLQVKKGTENLLKAVDNLDQKGDPSVPEHKPPEE